MALGLPIPKKLGRIIKNNEIMFKLVLKLYRPYLKLYLKLWTWWHYNRFHSAKIDPFKLLWVKPQEIEYSLKESSENYNSDYLRSRIRSGDWDQEIEKFESRAIFKSILMRFEDGKTWQETPRYQNALSAIKGDQDNYHYRASSEEELKESMGKIDNLYSNIKEKGYKPRIELKKPDNSEHSQNIDDYLPAIQEIVVSIGRNGDLLFEDGNHRLSITKILELDKIPVRVLVRHEEWQEKRNMAVENPEELPEDLKNHPDIEYLLK